jgi:hypothetical protein
VINDRRSRSGTARDRAPVHQPAVPYQHVAFSAMNIRGWIRCIEICVSIAGVTNRSAKRIGHQFGQELWQDHYAVAPPGALLGGKRPLINVGPIKRRHKSGFGVSRRSENVMVAGPTGFEEVIRDRRGRVRPIGLLYASPAISSQTIDRLTRERVVNRGLKAEQGVQDRRIVRR